MTFQFNQLDMFQTDLHSNEMHQMELRMRSMEKKFRLLMHRISEGDDAFMALEKRFQCFVDSTNAKSPSP